MLKCPRWFTCQKSEYLSGWNQTDKDYCWLVALDFAFLWGKSIKWPAFKFIDFFFLPLFVAVLLRARDVWSEGSFHGRVDGWVPPYLLQWLTHSKIKHRQLRELYGRLLLSSGDCGLWKPFPHSLRVVQQQQRWYCSPGTPRLLIPHSFSVTLKDVSFSFPSASQVYLWLVTDSGGQGGCYQLRKSCLWYFWLVMHL